jgi:GNAT superfamily N-acetyltransferase
MKMDLSFTTAVEADAGGIAALSVAVAEHLTRQYGQGRWSSATTEKTALRNIRTSRLIIARNENSIVAALRLATKKPWAIDPKYFTCVRKPLYLTDMTIAPAMQRKGVGRRILEEAANVARAWPGDAIRLDAYDAEAGAGKFYAKCGFREMGRITYRKTPLIYFELIL